MYPNTYAINNSALLVPGTVLALSSDSNHAFKFGPHAECLYSGGFKSGINSLI